MPAGTFTKVVSATGAVCAKPARLYGITCIAGTSPTLRLHDHGSAASGNEIHPAAVQVIGTPIFIPAGGIPLRDGLYATVGGTASPAFVLTLGEP